MAESAQALSETFPGKIQREGKILEEQKMTGDGRFAGSRPEA